MSEGNSAEAEWNRKIVEEFRANGGKVGGPFEGAPMLLLHHTGARSGTHRVNPLVYQASDGDSYAIFASNAGRDKHPAWYHNLLAQPRVTVEVGTEEFEAVSRVAEGEEREEIWERQKQMAPTFAEYEAGTPRQIPVVVLEPAATTR